MEIVELQKEGAELCKELRLRALKDAPTAFAETYEDALERDDDYWDLISSSMVEPNKQRMFIAKESENYIGSVYAIMTMDDKSSGRLGGMWVDSRYRQKRCRSGIISSSEVLGGRPRIEKSKIMGRR